MARLSPTLTDVPIHALNHVGISTPDLPRLVAFYRDLLGFPEVGGFSWPVGNTAADEGMGVRDSSADVAILNAGNMYLELFCFHTPTPAPLDPLRSVADEGITHLCLETSDTDAVFARLAAGGAHVESEPVSVAGVVRIAAVRDPDGNIVELQQMLTTAAPTWSGHLEVVVTPPAEADTERRQVELADGVLGVNHVGLSTGDLHRHLAFYRDAGRLSEVARDGWDTTVRDGAAGSAAEHVVLDAGNVFLDFTHYTAPTGRPQDPARPLIDHGLNHLCFDVSAIDALHAELVDAGLTYHKAPVTMPAGNAAMGYARDPLGTWVELLENRTTRATMWCGHLQIRANPS